MAARATSQHVLLPLLLSRAAVRVSRYVGIF